MLKDSETHLAHAAAPLTLSVSDWLHAFHQAALLRPANTAELSYWEVATRRAQWHSAAALQALARETGRAVFESGEYLNRNTNNTTYVSDLYWSYLGRQPDGDPDDDKTSWGYWVSQVASQGRENVRRAFDESQEFYDRLASLTPGANPPTAANVQSAKLDALNETGGGGVNPLSRNFNWSMPLVSLPGRAGLDLGVSLSYNSLVWTQSGPYAYFDEENGWPAPGFRLGFPTIQERTFNAEAGALMYLLIMPNGGRVELRQQSGGAYEAVDGSYLQLTENGASSLSLRTTDGTLMSYAKINNEWRCAEVKDRNGNYLTAAYKWWGGLDQVTDTLGRLLTFHYDNKKKLTSIRQSWNGGAATQYWARFEYDAFEINPVFSGPQITGTRGGQVWPVLAAVVMPDNSRYQFSYNNNGQVNKIENLAADSHKLNHLFYLLDNGPLADRVTQAKVWAEDWQNETEVTAASYAAPVSASWTLPYNGANQTGLKSVVTTNDGVESRLYFGDAGWQRGLGLFAETYANNAAQRWTATEWDDEADNTLRGCYRIALDAYDKTQSTLVGQGLNLAFSVGVFGAVKDVADAAEGFRDGFRAVYSLRAGARIPINGGAQYAKVTVGGGFKRAFFGGLKGAGRGAGGLLSLGLMGAGTILSGGDHFFGSGAWLRGAIRSCNQGNPNASKFVEPGLGIGLAGRVRSFLP